jgi:hypothetical protein
MKKKIKERRIRTRNKLVKKGEGGRKKKIVQSRKGET